MPRFQLSSAQLIAPRQIEIEQEFARAIRSGDLNTIKHFLEAPPSQLEARDERGISTAATCWAVMALSVGLDEHEVTDAFSDRGQLTTVKTVT